jgi:hypothetical protein
MNREEAAARYVELWRKKKLKTKEARELAKQLYAEQRDALDRLAKVAKLSVRVAHGRELEIRAPTHTKGNPPLVLTQLMDFSPDFAPPDAKDVAQLSTLIEVRIFAPVPSGWLKKVVSKLPLLEVLDVRDGKKSKADRAAVEEHPRLRQVLLGD